MHTSIKKYSVDHMPIAHWENDYSSDIVIFNDKFLVAQKYN